MTHTMITETLHAAGLSAPAQIRVDKWGIPHLRAASGKDGFFVQGFNAARDRLWQIDLWRKRGLGRLAASFGPGYLEQDVASRMFLYRGDRQAEWDAYAPDMEEICTAFVAGVNAYIALCDRDPSRLPPEFSATGTTPERWEPFDVVCIRSHALTRNAISEVTRSCVLASSDAAADLLRKNIEPARLPDVPVDISLSEIPMEVLKLFKLGTAGVSFERERLDETLEGAGKWTVLNEHADVVADADWTGSNNWAVAGSRTETGRPILAGDPHRAHAIPALRYFVHLTTPEYNAFGAGEPCIPGITMGHNERIAFATTIFGSDQEDIYLYDVNPEDEDLYRYQGGWERMASVEERFEVKGHPIQTRVLKFTRHGPVLYRDPARARAFALRSVWFSPGSGAYLAGVQTMRASGLTDFQAAIERFGAPALNHVYADVEGTIAWLPYGFTPIRENWDGLLPVQGDGRHEWKGFVPLKEMPRAINPVSGFVCSANEYNIPADWRHRNSYIGYEWLEKSRGLRIAEQLAAQNPHSIAQSLALQTDTKSLPGLRLKALVLRDDFDATGVEDAVGLLRDWDGMLECNSAGGLLSEVWYTDHLKPAVFETFIIDPKLRGLLKPGDVEGILCALEAPGHHFGADPKAGRDKVLRASLRAAFDGLQSRFGPSESWKWGDLHHAYFEHPLSRVIGADWAALADAGPLPKAGSASTVMHAAYRDRDYRVVNGASIRFVFDVGNWDASYCINGAGQAGDFNSPHYRDHIEKWAAGDYVPCLFSEAAVDAATAHLITLLPAEAPTASDAQFILETHA